MLPRSNRVLSSTSEDLLMEACSRREKSFGVWDREPSQTTAANLLLLYNVALGQKEMAPPGLTLRHNLWQICTVTSRRAYREDQRSLFRFSSSRASQLRVFDKFNKPMAPMHRSTHIRWDHLNV